MRFKKAELLELSLVSVPANPGATITEIRAIDAAIRRGETPSAPQASSLWREVWDAGQRAMDELRAGPGYQKASSASRMAGEARVCGAEMVKALAERVENLERQQAENTVKYCGVWQPGQRYSKGNLVTFHGSAWHCNRPTNGKPGEDHDGWTLAVRRGKDGRDIRP